MPSEPISLIATGKPQLTLEAADAMASAAIAEAQAKAFKDIAVFVMDTCVRAVPAFHPRHTTTPPHHHTMSRTTRPQPRLLTIQCASAAAPENEPCRAMSCAPPAHSSGRVLVSKTMRAVLQKARLPASVQVCHIARLRVTRACA